MRWVRKRWWTDEQGKTDASGSHKTRGFLGDYEITATYGGKTGRQEVKLGRDGASLSLRLP